MRTARALTISPSMLCAGGGRGICSGGMPGPVGSAPGGDVCSWGSTLGGAWSGGSAPGGVSAPGGGGIWSGGGIPACTEADPPCEQNHTRL